ncbi:50S ribosomal protein L25/general stress protein Ctc [Aneurinibacillus terranovensis]|uniref:50S ribosomal protein L25/general stress protein Ctc n=1 Tax=Aneurinibacillus terranovensis TaxID=278991 RepID=UPI0003F5EDC9|nr:50S ribosomal protein L25/general stress protein Ctc [Aneurinibacillus terranovensis]
MTIELLAEKRDTSHRSTLHGLRKNGKIPAVIYGSGLQSQPITVDEGQFLQVIRKQGINHIITLKVDGSQYDVLIKDVQQEPLKGKVMHLDFNKVNMNEEIETMVHIVPEGEAAGMKEGGILQQSLRELTIRCLPNAIPDAVTVSIEHLAIGDSVSVGELRIPAGVTPQHEKDEIVLSITAPQLDPIPDSEERAGEEQPANAAGGPSDEEK